MEKRKEFSDLEIISNFGNTSGAGMMKLFFTKNSKNSLSEILKIGKALNTIMPEGMNL